MSDETNDTADALSTLAGMADDTRDPKFSELMNEVCNQLAEGLEGVVAHWMTIWGDKAAPENIKQHLPQMLLYNCQAATLRAVQNVAAKHDGAVNLCDFANALAGGLLEAIPEWKFSSTKHQGLQPDKDILQHVAYHMDMLAKAGPFDSAGNLIPFDSRPVGPNGRRFSTVQMMDHTVSTVSREDLDRILAGEIPAPDPRLEGCPTKDGQVDKSKLN